MNKVEITGNLTADVELKQTTGGKSVCDFTLGVRRPHTKDKADFIDFTAWGSTAEFICRYFRKGDAIEITGSINTDTIARRCAKCGADNKQRKATVSVDTAEFPATKRAAQETPAFAGAASQFEEIPAGDDQLPF